MVVGHRLTPVGHSHTWISLLSPQEGFARILIFKTVQEQQPFLEVGQRLLITGDGEVHFTQVLVGIGCGGGLASGQQQ